jgi:diguanylate cyclase
MRRLAWVCGLLMALLGSGAMAASMPGTAASQAIGEGLLYLQDDSHRLQLDAVRALPDTAWQRNQRPVFNRGYSPANWWLRVEIRHDPQQPAWQLLEIAYPLLDDVEAWVLVNGIVREHQRFGDTLPFNTRSMDHRNFLLPLQLAEGEDATVILRVHSTSSVQVPLTLWQERPYFVHDQDRLLGQGLYVGTMVVMALYNLFLFFVLRDRTYLYYVAAVLSTVTFMASLRGLTFQHLWPDATAWANHAIIISISGIVVFSALFAIRLLRLRKHLPFFYRTLMALAGVSTVLAVLTPLVSYSHLIRVNIVVVFFASLCGLVAGGLRWRRGDATAKIYTLAWSSMLMGAILMALNKFGMIPQNVLTENAVQIGSALEVVLLSFALAARFNEERRLRFEAQQLALDTQRQANETLELRVQERTEELEEANRKLAEISATDQLTGLRNRRHLDVVMREEFARCQRHQRPLAVLLMDIDHFKRFNDDYGHLVGDDCLRRVAGALQIGIRWPSDRLARWGGEEFCMILPETDAEGARIVAERVRGAVEAMVFEVEGRRVPVTVSIGVCAQVPDGQIEMRQLITLADEALYASKAAGRNRVTVSGAAEAQADAVS